MNKVFVYGTLKNSYMMLDNKEDKLISSNVVTQDFFFVAGNGFPRAVKESEYKEYYSPYLSGRVKGELYEVTDSTLERLDSYEGHPSFYERQEVPLWNLETKQYEYGLMYIAKDSFDHQMWPESAFHKPDNTGMINWK